MTAATIEVDINELTTLVDKNLALLELDTQERSIICDVLMYAELRGKSQGLIKILEKTVTPAPDRVAVEITEKTPSIHQLRGHGNPGMVVLNAATTVTIDACKRTGLALTGTEGTASSTGSIGFYATKMATAGYIGIVMAGSPKVMAVSGSLTRALGTNPLAIAIPTSQNPLVLDMATSATTWFDMIRCRREGVALSEGVACDTAGQPTTDPVKALDGVMQTFAGSKGSGLALMIEMLTGPLMGASIVNEDADNRGNFLLAINPAALNENFVARVDAVLDAIRTGPLLPGVEAIRLPGEQSLQRALAQQQRGRMTISRDVFEELSANVVSHDS